MVSTLKAPSSFIVCCSSSVHNIFPFVTFFLKGNNSALGGHRVFPKVANERYCYIFLIFGVGIAGTGTGNWHQQLAPAPAKIFYVEKYIYIFFSGLPKKKWACGGAVHATAAARAMGARRAPLCTAQQWGPEGPHRVQRTSPPQVLEVGGP